MQKILVPILLVFAGLLLMDNSHKVAAYLVGVLAGAAAMGYLYLPPGGCTGGGCKQGDEPENCNCERRRP